MACNLPKEMLEGMQIQHQAAMEQVDEQLKVNKLLSANCQLTVSEVTFVSADYHQIVIRI